jgi:hypothetical protein
MEEDPPITQTSEVTKTTRPSRPKITKNWEGDTTILQLSATFVANLQVEQEKPMRLSKIYQL